MIETLLIQSKDRILGDHNSFTVKLINPIQNVTAIRLLEAHIPNTIYNITSSNDEIIFNEGGGDLTVTLDPGAYDVYTLISEIESEMNTVGSNTYTVQYSTVTCKIRITSSSNFTILGGTMLHILGFEPDPIGTLIKVGTNCIRLHTPKHYLIKITELTQSTCRSTSSNISANFILSSKSNSQEIDVHYANSNYNIVMNDSIGVIANLNVSIYDEDGTLLQLNGSDWTMLLQIYTGNESYIKPESNEKSKNWWY